MDRIALDNWSAQVEDVLDRCLCNERDPAGLLEGVFAMLATGPAEICQPINPALSGADLQQLLDIGAFESAALRMVGRCGYLLSRSGDGQVIASVVLPGSQNDYSFNAFSEPIALCGALVTCIHERLLARQ